MSSAAAPPPPRPAAAAGPVERRLRAALAAAFAPLHLDVLNESHKHSAGDESHFTVFVVSDAFEGLAPVARHRAVLAAAAVDGALPCHALSIKAATRAQWAAGAARQATPDCEGGDR